MLSQASGIYLHIWFRLFPVMFFTWTAKPVHIKSETWQQIN